MSIDDLELIWVLKASYFFVTDHAILVRQNEIIPVHTHVGYTFCVEERLRAVCPFENGQRRNVSMAHDSIPQPINAVVYMPLGSALGEESKRIPSRATHQYAPRCAVYHAPSCRGNNVLYNSTDEVFSKHR